MGWEPLPSEQEPVRLEESLAALQRYLGTARPDSLATLQSQWTSVIGRHLAAHCSLHSLRRGSLVVSTADPGVAEQLRWLGNDLVAAANSLLGSDEVLRVEVRVERG